MSEWIIRPVNQEEISELVILCEEHAAFEGAIYDSSGKVTALRSSLFGNPSPLTCFVLEVNKKLVGYTTFMKQYSTWDAHHYIYMDCLYLNDEMRSKDFGKRLLSEVIKYAQSENCQEIQWQTPESNVRAIQFYEREGAIVKKKARCFLKV